jgi:hypothetical protein
MHMRHLRYLLIVRRGETQLYHELQNTLDRWPDGTTVMWDRRLQDRRVLVQQVTIERRIRQRRAEPDSMWYTHRFIVVETARRPTGAGSPP